MKTSTTGSLDGSQVSITKNWVKQGKTEVDIEICSISGNAARLAMPNLASPVTTTVTEAMHFQRGLHYLIVKVRVSSEI